MQILQNTRNIEGVLPIIDKNEKAVFNKDEKIKVKSVQFLKMNSLEEDIYRNVYLTNNSKRSV